MSDIKKPRLAIVLVRHASYLVSPIAEPDSSQGPEHHKYLEGVRCHGSQNLRSNPGQSAGFQICSGTGRL